MYENNLKYHFLDVSLVKQRTQNKKSACFECFTGETLYIKYKAKLLILITG